MLTCANIDWTERMQADHRTLIFWRARLLFLAFLFVGTWSSRTHRLNVRTSDGATHTVSFGNSPAIADVDASRFCAKYGVLDDECSKLATSMKSVQAKSCDQWGMSISSPFEGSLVQVPGDLHVVVDYFFEKEMKIDYKFVTKVQKTESLDTTEATSNSVTTVQEVLSDMMGDAPACNECGHITIRNGSCYKCLNCGNSLGCS